MNIAIIGSGNVGSALAKAFTAAGHDVVVTSEDMESAEGLSDTTAAETAESNKAAAADADIVVLAVPYDAVASILGDLDGAAGKILIDVTNRIAPDDPASAIDGTSNAESIQVSAPESRVVKAFNTVFAGNQADPVVDGIQLDGFVAGDDESAKADVLALAESVGLRPLDVGGLAMARALEAMGALNISLQMRNGWSWQTGWKLVGQTT